MTFPETDERETMQPNNDPQTGTPNADRRAFLGKVGKFAAVTPPVVTLMLAGAHVNPAIAQSGFGHPHRRGVGHRRHGRGHGHGHYRRRHFDG